MQQLQQILLAVCRFAQPLNTGVYLARRRSVRLLPFVGYPTRRPPDKYPDKYPDMYLDMFPYKYPDRYPNRFLCHYQALCRSP